MKSKNYISINLMRYRKIRGLTQEAAAEKSGISRNAFRSIESGKAEPKVSNLQKIANTLEVNIYDLLKPIPKLDSLRFRSLKSFNQIEANKKKQLEINFAVWLDNFNFLENILNKKKKFELKSSIGKYSEPIQCAKELRKKLKINETEPINNINDLLESMGIKIYTFDSDLPGVFGMSLNDTDGGPAIGVNVNKSISVERQIFTVAHELGHILLHPDTFNSNEELDLDKHEKEANAFAGYFLMPDKAFLAELNKNRGLYWLDLVLHIKRALKVSYMTVLRRLVDIKLVDDSVWQKFAADMKRRYRISLKNHYEPDSLVPEEAFPCEKLDFIQNRMSRLVREAFEKELITLDKASEILNITLNEMRELANSWRFVA